MSSLNDYIFIKIKCPKINIIWTENKIEFFENVGRVIYFSVLDWYEYSLQFLMEAKNSGKEVEIYGEESEGLGWLMEQDSLYMYDYMDMYEEEFGRWKDY